MSKNGFTDPKQVIVARRDLNMPAGKLAAQVAHASVRNLLNCGYWVKSELDVNDDIFVLEPKSEAMEYWMKESFPKVVLMVDSEEELEDLYSKALIRDLPASLIEDSGRTVFDGVYTVTCMAIGPAERSEIDSITGHLPLYKD
jgi:PTH2 family peptidyl-tRNA hydrolase